jgi:hypothetical protein
MIASQIKGMSTAWMGQKGNVKGGIRSGQDLPVHILRNSRPFLRVACLIPEEKESRSKYRTLGGVSHSPSDVRSCTWVLPIDSGPKVSYFDD